MYPDNYWQFHAESNTGMINYINVQYPLQLINVDVRDQGNYINLFKLFVL